MAISLHAYFCQNLRTPCWLLAEPSNLLFSHLANSPCVIPSKLSLRGLVAGFTILPATPKRRSRPRNGVPDLETASQTSERRPRLYLEHALLNTQRRKNIKQATSTWPLLRNIENFITISWQGSVRSRTPCGICVPNSSQSKKAKHECRIRPRRSYLITKNIWADQW